MTKREAYVEACYRWFTSGTTPDDVVAYAYRGRTTPRYRVGASKRNGVRVARGESDESWELAFADADARRKRQTEEHRGCGGAVVLRHEIWVCRACGAGPIPVADTDKP